MLALRHTLATSPIFWDSSFIFKNSFDSLHHYSYTQACPSQWQPPCPYSYINADYVKWLEGSGMRVIPVHFNSSLGELTALFAQINGLLFPGGGDNWDWYSSQYMLASQHMFDLARAANDAGDVFPIWGTCLGFEVSARAISGSVDVLSHFDTENISLPLTFANTAFRSKMLAPWSEEERESLMAYLQAENATENYHHLGVSTATYSSSPALSTFYSLVATSTDRLGQPFVAAWEARKYPFFATQFHPERTLFEWAPNEAVDHREATQAIMRRLGGAFTHAARRSAHRFASDAAETSALIENTAPVFSYRVLDENPADFQMYFF